MPFYHLYSQPGVQVAMPPSFPYSIMICNLSLLHVLYAHENFQENDKMEMGGVLLLLG